MHFCRERGEKIEFILLHVGENPRQRCFYNVLGTSENFKSHRLPGEIGFGEVKLYKQTEFGIEL